jgi:hypothetical protein
MVFFSRGASLKFIQTKRNDTTVLHRGSIILQVAVGIMLIILGRREQLSINNAKLVEKNSKEENLQKTDETNDDEDKKKKVPNESMSLAEEADCLKKDQSTMNLNTIILEDFPPLNFSLQASHY